MSTALVNQTLTFYPALGQEQAESLFIRYNHLDLSRPKHQRLLERGRALLAQYTGKHSSRVVMSIWPNPVCADGNLLVQGQCFDCRAFWFLRDTPPLCAVSYFMTVGDLTPLSQQMTDQLCADSLGTILLDMTRSCFETYLQDCLMERALNVKLSPSFGPGFYGMPVTALHQLELLCDPATIGIQLGSRDIMHPQKSCAGIYLLVDAAAQMPSSACADCSGNVKSCDYCRMQRDN